MSGFGTQADISEAGRVVLQLIPDQHFKDEKNSGTFHVSSLRALSRSSLIIVRLFVPLDAWMEANILRRTRKAQLYLLQVCTGEQH